MPVAINTNINTPHVSRKLTVNMDQALINVRPIIKGAINEAAHTLSDAFLSSSSLKWSTQKLETGKRDLILFSLFKSIINAASVQSRDFAVQLDGCKGVLVWSDRSQFFSWPQTISTFKFTRLMGTIRSFVKPNNNPVDKVRRRIMNEYPKKHLVISFLGVLPQEQGKGVGTALMEYLLDKADAAQYVVYVEAVDYQTVKFFERFGFVSQGPVSLSKDKSVAITPMVRQPVMSVNDPEPFYIRPGRRDSDKST